MSTGTAAIVLGTLLVLTSSAFAQAPAECAFADCAAAVTTPSPSSAPAQILARAGAIRALKVEFVAHLQRFTRAQAGTFGDEGEALADSVRNMSSALARWDAAVQRLQSEAGRLAPSAALHIIVATVLLEAHRRDAALRELEAAERLDQGRADVQRLEAIAYELADRRDDAARARRAATRIEPDDPASFYALAQELTELHRNDDAADARRGFRRALSRGGNPGGDQPRAPFERVDLLREVAGAAPIFPQGRYAPGFAALHDGKYADAVASFTTAMIGDPLIADVPVRGAIVSGAQALRRGDVPAALRILEPAAASQAGHSEAHRILGLAYWIDGQTGRSIEQLRAAIGAAPADERARVLLADVLVSEGRASEADRELKATLEACGPSGQIHYRLAQLALKRAVLPEASADVEASLRSGPVVGRGHLYQMLGRVLVERADFDGAVAAYTRRIEVNPNVGEAHRQLAEIYFLQGRDDEALTEFAAASWLDPRDARAYVGAAHVYVRLSKYTEAATAARRALQLDPDQRQARFALGTALMRLGETDEGAQELAAFEQQEAAAAAVDRRAFTIDALRREASRAPADRAVASFEEIVLLDPDDPRSQRDLAMALLRAGRPQDAIPHLLAAQGSAETLDGFKYLAEAFVAIGDTTAAAEQLTRYQRGIARAKADRIRELAGAR